MKKLLILFLLSVSISAQSFAQALMYNPWVENIVAGEDIDSISIPAWVYFSAVDGKAYLADNIVNRAQALVFAPIEADSAGQAMFAGIYEWPDSLDVGKSYYLTSTAGRTSSTRVANASTVGVAVSATRMLIGPGRLSPNGIDESIYTTNGTIPGNVARHISLDSAAAISITYPIGQPMLTLYSGDDSTCVNASVFMQSPDGDTEFLLNDANLVLGRNGNYTYYTDTSITSSVTVGAVTGSFNIKADSTEVTKPVVLVGDPLGTGISDGTLITRKWAEDNLSGGGGGASYLVYTALLTQSGEDAPTAIVLENTLGGTVVWTWGATGRYYATLTGAFTEDKTWWEGEGFGAEWQPDEGVNSVMIRRLSADVMVVETGSAGDRADGVLRGHPIEFRVYP